MVSPTILSTTTTTSTAMIEVVLMKRYSMLLSKMILTNIQDYYIKHVSATITPTSQPKERFCALAHYTTLHLRYENQSFFSVNHSKYWLNIHLFNWDQIINDKMKQLISLNAQYFMYILLFLFPE